MTTTKIIIHPDFSELEKFIKQLPDDFEKAGTLIYDGRNQIRCYEQQGFSLAVKRYKIPLFVNRLDYTFLRPSKARRAYDYALKLEELGFDTPAPVGYIEIYENGLFKQGYFISLMVDATQIRFCGEVPEPERSVLLREFAAYTARLHQKGVFHIDYSPGNILFHKEGAHYRFYLIDLNRMKFDITDRSVLMRNFERITEDKEELRRIAEGYADVLHKDRESIVAEAYLCQKKFQEKQEKKRRLKRLIK